MRRVGWSLAVLGDQDLVMDALSGDAAPVCLLPRLVNKIKTIEYSGGTGNRLGAF